MTLRTLSRLALSLAALVFAIPAGAQQTDVIRGRVTGPDNRPIEGVQVTATSVSGGVNRNARTNNDGRFTITFPGGDGDYIVTMNRIGFAPRQFQVKRTADQDILVSDAKMNVAPLPEMASPLPRQRKICLALPEAHEVEAWGEPTFRVKGGNRNSMGRVGSS